MAKKVIVYSMPRAQTQWMAKVMGIDHEGFSRSKEDSRLDYVLGIDKGVVDGNLVFYRNLVKTMHKDSISFVVIRPVHEVIKSLKDNGLPYCEDHLNNLYTTLVSSGLPILEYPLNTNKLSELTGESYSDEYDDMNIDKYRKARPCQQQH